MKIMFASDIHGSLFAAEEIAKAYEREGAQRLVLLGDLLYHGPRNPLPEKHDPQSVAKILNAMKNNILCVRGNCDSEVDQMVLEFPIMSPYALLEDNGRTMFLTHGHIYNEQNLPAIKPGDIFINGHTHVPCIINESGHLFLNPGSAALPKNNFARSYMMYKDNRFVISDFNGSTIFEYEL